MKFGQKIKARNDSYSEWRAYYLDYTGLKKFLKARTSEGRWTTEDEDKFVAKLEAELEKIHEFQMTKASELGVRINNAERSVKILVDQQNEEEEEETQAERDVEDGRAPLQPDRADDEGSDDELDDGIDDEDDDEDIDDLEENFRQLEEEVATIVADVHDLALYTKLNFTGFVKIVKKHDKQTKLTLKRTFVQDYLEKRPFYKYNWDSIIVKLSKLYDLVRTRGHPVQGDSSAGGGQSAFVRQTTKYWVHPDNLVHLKLAILRHLPVLVFNPNKEFEPSDSAITSIYFDNEDLELYLGRLEKTEGAEAVRLRWYGDMSSRTIFVERKTHREDWTGEKSVKERFPIKEDKVNAFLRGEYTMDEEFRALVKKGKKTEQEVEGMIQLASEVQYAILTRKLVPVMRSFYNRTAFQLPGDARVRISLDTELTMVREDNWDGEVRTGDNWRRPDAGIDFPFPRVPDRDKEIFKYGVLEVKLQTQLGQEPPQWVRDLVSSHLVESVPNKFIHGCATLLPNRVDLVPFWLPQMDADIRKPDTGNVAIGRPISTTTSPETHTPASESEPTMRYTEPVSEGEEDEPIDVGVAQDEGRFARLDAHAAAEAIKERQAEIERQKLEEHQRQQGDGSSEGRLTSAPPPVLADDEEDERTPFLRRRRSSQPAERPKMLNININPLAPSKSFDKNFKSAMRKRQAGDIAEADDEQEDEDENAPAQTERREETEYVRHFTAQPGKKIAVPVRVEPKVYFANERTFLKWLQFGVLIGTVATTLLNFSKPGDHVAFVSAICFTFAALLAIAYAGVIFVVRALKLRTREVSEWYYDRYGPTVLSVVLLASIVTNLVMRISEGGF